jgi:hypothetical protein
MARLVVVTLCLLVGAACVYDDSCDRLADYACSCHPEDTDACASYQELAQEPSSAVLDECVVDLGDLQAEDEDAGLNCDAG